MVYNRHVKTLTQSTSKPPLVPPSPSPPRIPRRRRFLRVSWFFFGIIAHVFFFDMLLNRSWLTRWYPRRSGQRRYTTMARQFRGLAVELGGVLIKLGQFLSARADILPAFITDELAGLQDEVPPAPLPHILAIIAEELGAAPEALFTDFDPIPVAAASLGQVYIAKLSDGREIAIKVQRPNIDTIVEIDLRAVHWAVRIIKNYPAFRRRADLEALFEEFARVLLQELDYIKEAQSARLFRSNFADTPGVYFPEPYPEFSTRRVLVMERVNGIKLNDYAGLTAAGIDRAEVATRLNRAFLKQFFIDGFFHADPHPGNMFVRADRPAPAQSNGATPHTPFTLIILDTGMVGELPPKIMEAIRSGVIGLATNDAERVVETLDKLHMILPGADRRPIIQAISIIFRHTYDRTQRELTNMDVEQVFADTEHLVRDMPFQIPQNLIYLGRAISLVSGNVTGLNPDINLFAEIQPFTKQLLERERGEQGWSDQLRRELTSLGQIAVTLPRQMDNYYKAANRGELQMRVDLTRLERSMRRVEHATGRLAGGIIATGLFLGGVLLRINAFPTEAGWAWAAAGLAILWTLWPRGQ